MRIIAPAGLSPLRVVEAAPLRLLMAAAREP
jgi:hypothetical protein